MGACKFLSLWVRADWGEVKEGYELGLQCGRRVKIPLLCTMALLQVMCYYSYL